MKIVYCLNSIRYIGGIQRVTLVKANALAEIKGNEVYIVVTDNKAGEHIHELSPKVHLIDLDINYYYRDQERSVFTNMLVTQYKRRIHRKALDAFLRRINPDIVISVGLSEKYMLCDMKNRTWKIIREFHHVRNGYRKTTAKSTFEKVMGPILDFYEFRIKDRLYDRIIVLTEEDKDCNWSGWPNVSVMPNPISFECEQSSNLNEKYVVAIGRIDPIKNFSSLINAYSKVVIKHPEWKLYIYGDGGIKNQLQSQIINAGLKNNVFLMGFTNDIKGVLLKSSILALSSISEGFSLVLVEAMECGLPVVSYQCPCGPKDIITDGKDGFLVPVGDEQMLADRICQLIENEELRRKMGAAAKEKARQYHIDEITKQWMVLFNEIVYS